MNQKTTNHAHQANGLALIPLGCFVGLFLGAGLYFENQGVKSAFYEVSSVVAIVPCIILSILLSRESKNKALNQFIDGIGHPTIITMCLIFLLAGGLPKWLKARAVEATTAMGLSFIPKEYVLPGFFLITAFISTSMGTSMGTLAAVAPVALGISETIGIDPHYMAGAIISGSMFGDNLSIISDTTIAATRTQGCEMRDKFKENIVFALPAAAITFLMFAAYTIETQATEAFQYNFIFVVPYLTILILAISGLNVFAVLSIGIILAAGIGMTHGDYSLMKMVKDLYADLPACKTFLLSMMIGGLAHLVQSQGGLLFIRESIEKMIISFDQKTKKKSHKVSEIGMGLIASLTNLCVANNTISILIAGPIAKELATEHQITPKRAASVLDIFSCVVQGTIPYGAQILLVSEAFRITPLNASLHAWYCQVLLAVAILFILFREQITVQLGKWHD